MADASCRRPLDNFVDIRYYNARLRQLVTESLQQCPVWFRNGDLKKVFFFMWGWIHCGTALGAFGVILVPFLGHLRSWGSVLGSPGLSWGHFGIHIRFCHHFWPNPSKNPSPFWDPFWDYYAYVDVFRAFFMMSDFVIHFWRDIGGCNVDEVL